MDYLVYLALALVVLFFAFEYVWQERKKQEDIALLPRRTRVKAFLAGLQKMLDEEREAVQFRSDGPGSETLEYTNLVYLTCEIYDKYLDAEQTRRFLEIAPENDRVQYSGGHVYKAYFNKSDLKKAAEFAEKTFTYVYQLPGDYKITQVKLR